MLAPVKPRVIRAARGNTLSARSWMTEAPLRMLMNNLDAEVAENPAELVVYGGMGRAARDWNCYDRIVETLKTLTEEETLLVQSGKPVGVFPTHADAPRVLIANSNLVPHWATWEHFHELDRKGLAMFGQMTAGSWIYIGSQGIVQGTYETFAEMGRRHFGGNLNGKWILTAGLGGMGGAQPLAATMAGASLLAVECRQSRIAKRVETGYIDAQAKDLSDALAMLETAKRNGKPISVALLGNIVDVLDTLLERGIKPDALTDQTSAHDPVNGYLPQGWSVEQWDERRVSDPAGTAAAATLSMAKHVECLLRFKRMGMPVFDYGNNIRQVAFDAGVAQAFDIPGFVPEYIRPLFCRGVGPFRWVALSGDPADIAATDAAVRRAFPDDDGLQRWLRLASERVPFQGLPARICWLGYGQRDQAGLAFNELVRRGDVGAPIVIGRDHLDSGSVASPYRETEAMADGSDAIADWPILNALLNVASGAAWVAVHHGGGVGMGRSIHAGAQVVADGTDDAALRLSLVLRNDPGTGVVRHADAGYPEAAAVARERGVRMPMLGESP